MSGLEWDSSLETGDALVDGHHRTLVAMFNDLHSAAVDDRGNEVVSGIVEGLCKYVATHFEAERQLMLHSGYPADAITGHLAQHDALTARTLEMVDDYHRGNMTTILPLAVFLQEWLGEHIRKTDKAFVAFLRAERARG